MQARIAAGIAFARRAWRLAGPDWRSEERWRARFTIAVIVVHQLTGDSPHG